MSAGVRATQAVALLAAAFIAGWEGYDPVAKHNSFDPPDVITIGNGLTNYDMPGLKAGMRCGKEVDCKAAFAKAMPKYDAMLYKCGLKADKLPPHRHVAMISFVYNVGQGNFCKSSVNRYMKQGKVSQACNALSLYTRANGRVLRGLVNRRKAERQWCLRND